MSGMRAVRAGCWLLGVALAAGTALASGKFGSIVPDGTNVWIGAVSGGSMSNAANWRAESSKGYTVEELFTLHCVYDLRGLANGAVVTNDLTAGSSYPNEKAGYDTKRFTLVAGVLAAGEPGDTWTVFQKGGTGLYFCSPCSLTVEGGTLVWDDAAGDMYPYKVPHKYGSGTFRFKRESQFWESVGYVHEGTLAFTNGVGTSTYRWQLYDGASLEVAGGTSSISQIGSVAGVSAATRLAIPAGATLDLCTGFNNYGSWVKFYGDVTGEGTLRVTGGGRHYLVRDKVAALSFAGCYQPYLGDLVFGTADKPLGLAPAASLDVAGSGWAFLYQDATVRALTGAGADGGVSWPADATLTLDGAAGETNVYAGRLAGGTLVKKGADHTLVLTGETRHGGAIRVEAGTLAVRRGLARPGLRAYWNFEDADDLGADASADGLMSVAVRKDPTFRPYQIADGVVGRAVHFGDGQVMKKGGVFLRARKADLSAKACLPSGSQPFTFSFWMRPTKGKCGNGTNFLHVDSGNGTATTERDEATMGVNWGNGFYFGSVKWDEAKGAAGGSQPAFKNLAFYCGTGWTRGGVWYDNGAGEKAYANRVAIAAFDDADYLFDGNWHHIVGTYSNRVIRIFVDGKKMGEKVRDADLNVTANPYIQVGSYPTNDDTGHTYQGDLDEIQWLVGAWSEEEVAAEYAARDPRARRAPLLPAPVAHWTFDEQADDRGYADVTGNGFDLENVASNGIAYVEQEAVTYADDPSFTGGAAWIKARTSHLRLKDGVDLGTRLTGSFTISLRTTYPANGAFFMLGNGVVANSVYLGDESCPRMQYWMVGGTGNDRKFKYADSGTYGQNGKATPSAYGVNTLVYDAQKKVLLVYRDAVLQTRASGITFALKPTQLQWGRVGEKTFANLRLDDLRLYDTALTGAQVAELARAVRQGAASAETTVLPPEARVEVAAGATFSARGVVDCVLGTLSGAGRVDIGGGSTLRAADYAAFAGTVSGAGCLDFDGAARMPSAATVAADVRMEALRLAVADAGRADPFVTTAGRVLVPATGRVTFPDAAGPGALAGKRWTLAKGASVTLPDDLSGWTVSPEPPVGWTFKASEDGTLTLSIGGGGTHLFLR